MKTIITLAFALLLVSANAQILVPGPQANNTVVAPAAAAEITVNKAEIPAILDRILDRSRNSPDDLVALKAAKDFCLTNSVKGDAGAYAGILKFKSGLAQKWANDLSGDPRVAQLLTPEAQPNHIKDSWNFARQDSAALHTVAEMLLDWMEANNVPAAKKITVHQVPAGSKPSVGLAPPAPLGLQKSGGAKATPSSSSLKP